MPESNYKYTIRENLQVFIRESKYHGTLPCFYSAGDLPDLEPLKFNWKKIREEVMDFEKIHGEIKGINTYSPPDLSSDVGWSNIYLENFMWRFHVNRKNFPFTCSIIDKIPNCTYGAISILSPNSVIKPHYGDTNGIIRCHLGLIIPDTHPLCGIKVGDEEQGWAEGELTLFTESHLHTTWNNSSKRRFILVVDIVPAFILQTRYSVCSKVLGAQTFNYFEMRIPILKNIPESFLGFIHFTLSALWRIYLPIQRKIKVL